MFLAAIVRGFAGFALSALLVLGVGSFRAPVEVLPVNLLLEICASLFLRGSTNVHADKRTARLLLLGSLPTMAFGLYLLTHLPDDPIRIALAAMVVFACIALTIGLRVPGARHRNGPLLGGAFTGLAAGLGSLGGLFAALFMLGRDDSAERVRATLSYFVGISTFATMTLQAAFGVMNVDAALRAASFLPLLFAGLWIGRRLFRPERQQLYRRACLGLLVVLSAASVVAALR